jgi:hypothetical protein
MMRSRLMRFIKRMTPRKFLLMMRQLFLLFRTQHAEFLLLDINDLIWLYGGEIVAVCEAREGTFSAEAPS